MPNRISENDAESSLLSPLQFEGKGNASLGDVAREQLRAFGTRVSNRFSNAFSDLKEDDPDFDKDAFYFNTIEPKFIDDMEEAGRRYDQYNSMVKDREGALKFYDYLEQEKVLSETISEANVVEGMLGQFIGDPVDWALTFGLGGIYSKVPSIAGRVALAAAEGGAYETAQRYLDPDRSNAESALTITGMTALTAMTGLPFGKLGKALPDGVPGSFKNTDEAEELAGRVVRGAMDTENILNQAKTGRTLSAAGATVKSMDSVTINPDALDPYNRFGILEKITKPAQKMSPREKVVYYSNPESREMLARLSRPRVETVGKRQGIADVVESVDDVYSETIDAGQKFHYDSVHKPIKYLAQERAKEEGQGFLERQGKKVFASNYQKVEHDVAQYIYDERISADQLEEIAAQSASGYEREVAEIAAKRKRYFEQRREAMERNNVEGFNALENYGGPQPLDRHKVMQDEVGFYKKLKKAANEAIEVEKRKLDNQYSKAEVMYMTHFQELSGNRQVVRDIFNQAKDINPNKNVMDYSVEELESMLKKLDGADKEIVDRFINRRAAMQRYKDQWFEIGGRKSDLEDVVESWANEVFESVKHGHMPYKIRVSDESYDPIANVFKQRFLKGSQFMDYLDTSLVKSQYMYDMQTGLKLGSKRVFGTTDLGKVQNDFVEKMRKKAQIYRDVAEDLQEGDGNLYAKLSSEEGEFADALNELGKDPDKIMAKASKVTAESEDVQKTFVDMVRDLENARYKEAYIKNKNLGSVVRSADVLLNLSTMEYGLLSMLPETVAPVLVNGFKPLFPLMKNYLKLAKAHAKSYFLGMSDELESIEALAKETGALGNWIVHDSIGDYIAQSGNLGESVLKGSGVLEGAMRFFYKANGMAYFDRFVRTAINITNEQHIRRVLKRAKAGKATTNEISDLADMGISRGEYGKLSDSLESALMDYKGAKFTDFSKLEPEVAQKFKRAIRLHNDRTFITPSPTDMHRFNAHPIGRLFLSFRSFVQRSTQLYMARNLSRVDAQALSTMAFMTMVGMFTVQAKEGVAGYELSGDTFLENMYAGLEASGYLGISHDLGLNFLLNARGFEAGGSIYANGDPLEFIMGPAMKYHYAAKDVGRVAKNAVDPEKSAFEGGMKNLWRIMPANKPISRIMELTSDEE